MKYQLEITLTQAQLREALKQYLGKGKIFEKCHEVNVRNCSPTEESELILNILAVAKNGDVIETTINL